MARPRRTLAVFVCCAAAVLAACSGGGDDEAGPSTTVAPDAEVQEFTLASASHPLLSVEIPDQPVASAPAEYDGFSIDVYALHRESERSVAVVFGLRNDSAEGVRFQRQLEDPTVDAPVDYTISGISLFDPVNLKRHLVFLDEDGGCLCSITSTVTVDSGSTLYLAAQFPAPPAEVDAMTLQTPLGSVSNVPLTDG